MSIHYVKGNLLESNCDYICHQVNCQGKMGSGVAKSIREKWSNVYKAYMDYYNYHLRYCNTKSLLGNCQFISVDNDKTVVNMFAQEYYGYDGDRYTSYDAFWECLIKITETVPKGVSIAFPGNIGCARGGGNWPVIYTMIKEVLDKGYDVYIYFYEEK